MMFMSMSLKPYDEAVKDYFKAIFPNTVYAPTDLAFKESAKQSNTEKAKLPLISVFRTPTLSIGESPNVGSRGFRRGAPLGEDQANVKFNRVRLLPIRLEYQVDIWTDSVEDVAAMFSEVLFYVKDYPAFEVELPNVPNKLSHNLEITEVVDNTDLLEEPERGRLGRMSIILSVDAFIAKFKAESLVLNVPTDVSTNNFPNTNNGDN